MGHRPQTADEIGENLREQLDWRFAERNDQAVAQALQGGQGVDAVHTLDEAGLLDGFHGFLVETGILAHWQTLVIDGVRRVFLPAICFVLLYGARVLFGITSSNALPSLLFSNIAVMRIIGFNARQVAEGLTSRGASQRTAASEYALMDPQTLAGAICKISAPALERLFNGTIQALAACGIFMAEVMVAVDGSQIGTPSTYAGCGRLAVTERHRDQQGTWVQVVKLVYGWRLIALIDLVTLIPVAIKIVQIQAHEAPHLLALVQQAQANLAPYSRIVRLVADRAYVDGPSLYALHAMGITFVVIGKRHMVARDFALAEQADSPVYERSETVRHGQGREQWTEDWLSQLRVVREIRAWASYRPPVVAGKPLAWRDRPTLTAVIVNLWRNQPPGEHGPRVYLTNDLAPDPWTVVDGYDDRSWIENGLFRNSKQFWTLTRWFPQKSAAGVRSHLTFVTMMLAPATAYRLWDQAQAGATPQAPADQISQVVQRIVNPQTGAVEPAAQPAPPKRSHLASTIAQPAAEAGQPAGVLLSHSLLAGQGPLRWRRQLQRENRDKVIVFIGPHYGIFDTNELLVLMGVPVRKLPPHLGSAADILRRYGCDPTAEPDNTS